VVPLHADHVATIRPTLMLLEAGVLVLLLIGTVNLVNLLLIRTSGRIKELAVRRALGASRGYVVSETVVETTLLTLTGGCLGTAVGVGGIRLLGALGYDRLPLGGQISFDMRLGLVALIMPIVLGVVLAAPIAWFNLRRHLGNALQSESRGWHQRARYANPASQLHRLADCLGVYSVGRSGSARPQSSASDGRFSELSVRPRPDRPNLASMGRLLGGRPPKICGKLDGQTRPRTGRVVRGRGQQCAFQWQHRQNAATIAGHVRRPGESARGHYSCGVAGDYFRAMGFSLRAGRFLTADDSRRSERVCVVDEDFARYYWPRASAIGQRLWDGSEAEKDAEAFTVVGVVGGVKQAGLTEDEAQGAIYYPYAFRIGDSVFVAVRTSLPPESFAAVGTYGVLSSSVAQRRREIGLRMALGAEPRHIRRYFVQVSLRLLAGGVLLGLIGAWLTGQAMQAMLFRVPAFNLGILAGALCIMTLVSLAACSLPSQRAARISPMETLGRGVESPSKRLHFVIPSQECFSVTSEGWTGAGRRAEQAVRTSIANRGL
jgi:hypothetical protein